jgi:glucokinase
MDDFPLVSALAEKVSTSIYLENDVNCMALGEYISLEQPVQSLVYISLGTSIGMGLVENYSILKGAHNQAGEIWRIPVECIHKKISKQGILHDFVSGEGIENAYKNVTGISLSAERIGELARTGDTLALMLYQTLGEILGKALVWIGNIIDPEILVLGGSVVKSNDLFIQNITNNFHENNITLHISSKGDDAALRGAAYASIQQHEQINE